MSNRTLSLRIWREVRPYWRHLGLILLLSLVAPPLALLTPLPLKIAVDNIIGSRPLPRILDAWMPESLTHSKTALLGLVVGLVVVVAVLAQLRDFGNSFMTAYTGEKLLRGFRAKLFRHVTRLSLSYHDTKGTGDSIYRIQNDAAALQRIAVDGFVPLFTSALTLGSMVYVTARMNWRLALVALAVSPIIFGLSRQYRRRLRSQSREVKKVESMALSVVQESLGAVRVVKAFGQEEREGERFDEQSNEGMKARLRLVCLEGGFGLLVALVTALGMGAVLFIGIRDVQSGGLTLGDLLLVMGYVAQLHLPLKTISKKMANLQGHLVSAERAFALLDEAPDVVERPNARRLARAAGAMAFRNVSFAYEHGRPVLSDISFAIEPGTCLGIAGATGAGKTTLLSLLTRFYDPTEGQVLLDGVDVRDYKLADLRNQFAIMLQEPVLFSSSIAENIAYARPGASESEIIAASRAANAHEFITRLPQGYETRVGERGMCLSGGERQRISLARAFLKDAPILILDEPTSSVDLKTETAIVEAMRRLIHGRTTFIIAHRLSTLQHSDLILRIEAGRLVEPKPTESAATSRPAPDHSHQETLLKA
jgi:ATP-binding cassette subfamily B protein